MLSFIKIPKNTKGEKHPDYFSFFIPSNLLQTIIYSIFLNNIAYRVNSAIVYKPPNPGISLPLRGKDEAVSPDGSRE
jgi:hypothetical protein